MWIWLTGKLGRATQNLCLGLFHKKRLCQGTITNREINLQEIELANDIDVKLLHIPGSEIEIEENEYNRRVATYISKKLKQKLNKQ